MNYVLVINSGSSSIKFQIVDPTQDASAGPLVSGLVEQIGEPKGRLVVNYEGEKYQVEQEIPDHTIGLKLALEKLDELGCGPTQVHIKAVGHRVVHGGLVLAEPEVLNQHIIDEIRDTIPLAPLHNPAHIAGIEVAMELLPDVTHVAVFDTGFFHNLPPASAIYALNAEVADMYRIRRYGAHGTSHEYVSSQVPALLDMPPAAVNQITLHLGNGASATAIRGGHAVDTSMGLTPLAGLVMGTRTGDIDPSIIFHLERQGNFTTDELDTLLNKKSGLKGLAGVNDFRELRRMINEDDQDAWMAYNVYIHQLRRFIGAYMISLGRVDAITFTAGVGENEQGVRRDSLANLEMYGIEIDDERNAQPNDGPRLISTDTSMVKVFVIPTNEELAIARKALAMAS